MPLGWADLFLVFYSVFRSGSAWRSGKSCKYEGGELNYSRKIVIAVARGTNCSRKIMYALALDANCSRKIVYALALDAKCSIKIMYVLALDARIDREGPDFEVMADLGLCQGQILS